MIQSMHRLDVACGSLPHFISAWRLPDPALCDAIVDYFEGNQAKQSAGATGSGVNHRLKKSTDINIKPKDLTLPANAVLAQYIDALYACYRDYLLQWPFLAGMLKEVDIGDFNIQRYVAGEHFASVHSERTTLASAHRVLVWMTYLNDIKAGDIKAGDISAGAIDAGGQTHFVHQDLLVTPERGKTLIWPAEWTHAHAGLPVTTGTKYIITGWMHFPPPAHFAAVARPDSPQE